MYEHFPRAQFNYFPSLQYPISQRSTAKGQPRSQLQRGLMTQYKGVSESTLNIPLILVLLVSL